jgi:hypothetical protein
MKYIISENRLNEIMTEYLNGWAESKTVSRSSPFIVIEEPSAEVGEWDIVMEYDSTDGRLYVSKRTTKHLMDLFGKNEIDVRVFVGEWFGKKFNVDVEFVE